MACLGLGTTAMAYGRAFGIPPHIASVLNLGQCQGELCFRGITPGVTTWEQAKQIFSPATTNTAYTTTHAEIYDDAIPFDDDAGIGGMLWRSEARSNVRLLDVYVKENYKGPAIPVAPFIVEFGLPCYLYVFRGPAITALTLVYPKLEIELWNVGSRLELKSQVTAVNIPDPSLDNFCERQGSRAGDVITDWHGFASINYYMNHARPSLR